jgi:hypothetical protein
MATTILVIPDLDDKKRNFGLFCLLLMIDFLFAPSEYKKLVKRGLQGCFVHQMPHAGI